MLYLTLFKSCIYLIKKQTTQKMKNLNTILLGGTEADTLTRTEKV